MTQTRLPMADYRSFYSPPSSALPHSDWRPPALSSLPSWANAKRIAIDIEAKDTDLKEQGPGVRRPGNRVVGVSFAIEDGPSCYLPISHEGGDNCEGDVWGYLRGQLVTFGGQLIGNGIGYDLDWLAENGCGVLSRRHQIMDVQVADVLIYELHNNYNLNALCARWGLPGKDEALLEQVAGLYRAYPKKDLWRFPARFVAPYAIADVERPLQILRRQEAVIERDGLSQIWELEQKVTPILIKMRRRGVRVDMERVARIEERSLAVEAECLDKLHALTGVRVAVGDVWKVGPLATALRATGIEIPTTAKSGKDSVDKALLKASGEVGATILRARDWNKLRTTFCNQIREHAIGDRIHCTFQQLANSSEDGDSRGVRYGRFSCTTPNLQQQPIRHDEFGQMWRSIFVADRDSTFVSSDWSTQEPRIAVHYAELLNLPGAKEFGDSYRSNPETDFHQKLSDLTGIARKIGKNITLGRLYGMGLGKMCKSIGMPTIMKEMRGEMRETAGPEGAAIIAQFDKFAPWISGLLRAASNAAERKGHVWTVGRRRCNFERGADGKYWAMHKALNRIIQGSAADQMKATLVAVDAEDIPVQLIVHDEIDMSVTDLKVAERVRFLQETTMKFSVPMKADLEIGPDWGNLEKI